MLSKPISRPAQPLRAISSISSRSRPIRLVARPNQRTLERDQRLEQLGRIVAVGDQVEIDEDDAALADAADVLDDMADRLLELLAAPRRRHDAEFAVVRAGARRLEHRLGQEMPSVEQVAPRERQVGQLEVVPLVVARPHPPGGEIAQQPRPGLLGIADADRVGVLLGLLRHQRDVRPAEHHRDAARREVARQARRRAPSSR